MALKTFVKISNVNNLSDARYCAGMYVNLMGFSLEATNEYFVDPVKFKEITGWVSGMSFVGEFKTSHPDTILETLGRYAEIETIQIEEEAHIQMLLNTSYALILKKDVGSNQELEDLSALAHTLGENNITLLLEASSDFSPDVSLIKNLADRCQTLLGFGFDALNVEGIVEGTGVKGIAMKGGHELKPGIRDFDELADILEVLEEDD